MMFDDVDYQSLHTKTNFNCEHGAAQLRRFDVNEISLQIMFIFLRSGGKISVYLKTDINLNLGKPAMQTSRARASKA